jgi:asparagine synthase (glutamine-hydrolysing)
LGHELSDLDAWGMQRKAALGTARVLIGNDTPTLDIPGGGIVIGDLYTHSGDRILDGHQVTSSGIEVAAILRRVLEDYWGDYILILPDAVGHSLCVLRNPSPGSDLQCLYSLSGGEGFITSDIPLATRLGLYRRQLDIGHVAHRLVYPNLKTRRTGLADIHDLPPGCALRVTPGATRVSQEWSPWSFVHPSARFQDERDATSAVRDSTRMVVGTWAREDGSTLLELSGGVDSSVVAACLRDARAQVTCATLRSAIRGADEREYAGLIADMLGVDLHSTELQQADARFDCPLPPHFATPVIGPLQHAIDVVMRDTAERFGARSFFSGAGGDTVFCYQSNASPAADAFRGAGLRTGVQTLRDISLFHQCTYWKAARLTVQKLLHPRQRQYDIDRTLLSDRLEAPEPDLHPWMSPPFSPLVGDAQRIFELSATQFYQNGCPRNHGRRFRMPLLSQPVIEACLRTPSWMWFTGGQNRVVARRAFSDVLPHPILARKSKGSFAGYLGAVFRRNRSSVFRFLLEGKLQAHGLLSSDELQRLAQSDREDSRAFIIRMLQLCTLENWMRHASHADDGA